MSAIERIEVIRGPMSTLYGSDAMGGVINIITRKVGKTWGGSITVDGSLQEESAFGDAYGGKFYLSGPIRAETCWAWPCAAARRTVRPQTSPM